MPDNFGFPSLDEYRQQLMEQQVQQEAAQAVNPVPVQPASAADPVSAVDNRPLRDTVQGVASGVGNFFSKLSNPPAGSDPTEDRPLKNVIQNTAGLISGIPLPNARPSQQTINSDVNSLLGKDSQGNQGAPVSVELPNQPNQPLTSNPAQINPTQDQKQQAAFNRVKSSAEALQDSSIKLAAATFNAETNIFSGNSYSLGRQAMGMRGQLDKDLQKQGDVFQAGTQQLIEGADKQMGDLEAQKAEIQSRKDALAQTYNKVSQKDDELTKKQEDVTNAQLDFSNKVREHINDRLEYLDSLSGDINKAFDSDRSVGRIVMAIGAVAQGIAPVIALKTASKAPQKLRGQKFQMVNAAGQGVGGAISAIGNIIDSTISQKQEDVVNKTIAQSKLTGAQNDEYRTQLQTYMSDTTNINLMKASLWGKVREQIEFDKAQISDSEAQARLGVMSQTALEKRVGYQNVAAQAAADTTKSRLANFIEAQNERERQEAAARARATAAADKTYITVTAPDGSKKIVPVSLAALGKQATETQGKVTVAAAENNFKNAGTVSDLKSDYDELGRLDAQLADYESKGNEYLPGQSSPGKVFNTTGVFDNEQESQIRSGISGLQLKAGALMNGSPSDREQATLLQSVTGSGRISTARLKIAEGRARIAKKLGQ